jgi:hypothetical protein
MVHTIMTIAPDVCAAPVLHFAALHDGMALSG